jgi:hypothetical protein
MGTHVAFVSRHVLPYVVVPHGSREDGWDLIQREPTSCLRLAMFCHTVAFHIINMREKDTVHSNRGCLRFYAVHAATNTWMLFP